MKVKELIERLKEHDQEAIIVVSAMEDGYHEANTIRPIKARLKPWEAGWWEGQYGESEGSSCNAVIDVVLIGE
jgi:hypothetical protein